MGQEASTPEQTSYFGLYDNQSNDSDKKEETSISEEKTYLYDDKTKNELLDIIINMKKTQFNMDENYKQIIKDIILENNDLIPISIELYQKLKEKIPDNKIVEEKKSSSSLNRKFIVRPRFSMEDLKKKLIEEDETISEISKKPLDIGKNEFYDDNIPFDNSLISLDEFNDSFRDITNGQDMIGITKVLLKNLQDNQKQQILAEYNKFLKNKKNSSKHGFGKSFYVYKASKRGRTDDINSFRKLVTIPIIINHLHRILSIRINKFIESQNIIDTTIQKGGIMNQSFGLFEQIYKIKTSLKIANSEKRKACVVFLDMKNAFGSLNIERLFEIMEHYHIPDNIIQYVKNFYEDFTYYIEVGKNKLFDIKWKYGLIQGCPLSPILFCLALNFVLKDVNEKFSKTHGFKYKNESRILLTAYMDDIAVITEDSSQMKEVLDYLIKELEKIGLVTNESKSACMYVNHTEEDHKLKNIENVEHYKYLGEYLSLDGTALESYRKFISELSSKLFRLDNRKFTSNNDKIALFISAVIPWIQRKALILYDVDKDAKLKILAVINDYLTKWDAQSQEFKLFTTLQSIFNNKTSDKIIRNMDKSEDIKNSENVSNDIELIKSTFKENNIRFDYSSINNADNLDLLLD